MTLQFNYPKTQDLLPTKKLKAVSLQPHHCYLRKFSILTEEIWKISD